MAEPKPAVPSVMVCGGNDKQERNGVTHPPWHAVQNIPRVDWAGRLSPVLFVGDFFHPVNGLAVEQFRDSDMRHGRGGGGAMPVFFAGRNQTISPG